ncbi:unnamed protein product [Nesidiocoris tenuis]|uniref:Uncharacterized protein n=1 Tax=Nesidiocoris tenuis TaxID=355587 RepID=A0A6H5GAT7_9HEMI|nr:unnamed protein product [Nesidiocoris tenuis]
MLNRIWSSRSFSGCKPCFSKFWIPTIGVQIRQNGTGIKYELDFVFKCDYASSQGPYLFSTQKRKNDISESILAMDNAEQSQTTDSDSKLRVSYPLSSITDTAEEEDEVTQLSSDGDSVAEDGGQQAAVIVEHDDSNIADGENTMALDEELSNQPDNTDAKDSQVEEEEHFSETTASAQGNLKTQSQTLKWCLRMSSQLRMSSSSTQKLSLMKNCKKCLLMLSELKMSLTTNSHLRLRRSESTDIIHPVVSQWDSSVVLNPTPELICQFGSIK